MSHHHGGGIAAAVGHFAIAGIVLAIVVLIYKALTNKPAATQEGDEPKAS